MTSSKVWRVFFYCRCMRETGQSEEFRLNMAGRLNWTIRGERERESSKEQLT